MVNRVSIAHISITFIRNKFYKLTSMIKDNIAILMFSEAKPDSSLTNSWFVIERYASQFR